MKKRYLNVIFAIIMTVLSFVSINSFAYGLTGTWVGQGSLILNGDLTEHTCDLVFKIVHTPNAFTVLQSDYFCKIMNLKSKGPQVLRIDKGQLFNQDNKLMGYISEVFMQSLLKTDSGLRQEYFMRRTPELNQLDYADFIEWNSATRTEIRGVLKKQTFKNGFVFM